MKKALITSLLLSLSITLIINADRDFIFDIHDSTADTEQYNNEALIVPVYQAADNDREISGGFAAQLPELYNQLPSLLEENDFSADAAETAFFSDSHHTIIASSLGSTLNGPITIEAFRRCLGRALQEASKRGIDTVHIALPSCVDATMKEIAQEIATITYISLYEYNAVKNVKIAPAVKRVCVHAHMQTPNDFKDVNIGLRIGSNLGISICQARDWINTPAHTLSPTKLAATSAQYILPYIAKIETIIFEKADIARMGMGGLIGASQGSDEPCALVTHYLKSRRPNVPTIALIGSGITHNVNEPSIDASGAAAVFTALNVFAYRNIPANILVIAPLVQQSMNESALKTGDLISMSNESIVEITDGKVIGNLILADAITYAITRHNPDYIIDIATLTDACKQTFGGCYAAIMSNDTALIECAEQSAARTGELVWQMPLNNEYTARLQSDIADLRNAPLHSRTAQTQMAGCFLQQFVEDTPWLHIDIAGAKTVREYTGHSAPAFGVRLLVDLVESLARGRK